MLFRFLVSVAFQLCVSAVVLAAAFLDVCGLSVVFVSAVCFRFVCSWLSVFRCFVSVVLCSLCGSSVLVSVVSSRCCRLSLCECVFPPVVLPHWLVPLCVSERTWLVLLTVRPVRLNDIAAGFNQVSAVVVNMFETCWMTPQTFMALQRGRTKNSGNRPQTQRKQ